MDNFINSECVFCLNKWIIIDFILVAEKIKYKLDEE